MFLLACLPSNGWLRRCAAHLRELPEALFSRASSPVKPVAATVRSRLPAIRTRGRAIGAQRVLGMDSAGECDRHAIALLFPAENNHVGASRWQVGRDLHVYLTGRDVVKRSGPVIYGHARGATLELRRRWKHVS